MPLHISEIGVRLAVGGNPTPAPAPAPARGGSGPGPRGGAGPSGGSGAAPITPDKVDEIVSLSVQRVLEHLRAIEAR